MQGETNTFSIINDPYIGLYERTNVSWSKQEEEMFKRDVVVLKAGYVGQLIYRGEIVWESKPYRDSNNPKKLTGREKAENAAEAAEMQAIRELMEGK